MKTRARTSARKRSSAMRNITKAHLSRIGRREPRSVGRELRKRQPTLRK